VEIWIHNILSGGKEEKALKGFRTRAFFSLTENGKDAPLPHNSTRISCTGKGKFIP
jgi:hypothetical protein